MKKLFKIFYNVRVFPKEKFVHRVKLIFLFFSFCVVAFAQPDWSQVACILTSCLGYALFWAPIIKEKKWKKALVAGIWFALIMAIHLNWFFADRYVGSYIYFFLVCLVIGLGAQFACITLLIREPREMKLLEILGISGGWTLLEWIRLHVLSGFSWDPVGLALTGTVASMQMASAVGIYGLSFWIFFTNLLALRFFSKFSLARISHIFSGNSHTLSPDLHRQDSEAVLTEHCTRYPDDESQVTERRFASKKCEKYGLGNGIIWGAVALTPYIFGHIQLASHSNLMQCDQHPPLSALLVQTAMTPEEKLPINGSRPLTPTMQWERILKLLLPHLNASFDLIVLPEGVVPYGTNFPLYTLDVVSQTFKQFVADVNFLPEVQNNKLGNRYWVQSVANATRSPVIVGFDDCDVTSEGKVEAYNAAFLVRPFSPQTVRYEKRILVPMGEYIPFNWCKKILSKYGIADSFTPGKQVKIFDINQIPAGVSICYEETYGELMRSNRRAGARLLINLSNDVWYPRSRLPTVHFLHGRLRAVENGVPLLRCCNTGLTCGVDALGRIVDQLPQEGARKKADPGTLLIALPTYHFVTFYTLFGDLFVIILSAFLFTSYCVFLFIRRKKFHLKFRNIYPLLKN